MTIKAEAKRIAWEVIEMMAEEEASNPTDNTLFVIHKYNFPGKLICEALKEIAEEIAARQKKAKEKREASE